MASLPAIDMTLTVGRPAVEQLVRAWVKENYPGYEVQSVSFTTERTYNFRDEEGTPIFGGVQIKLKPYSNGR